MSEQVNTVSEVNEQLAQKQAAAQAALEYIEDGMILGVGTGSTINCLIDLLAQKELRGAVASSKATELKLKALGIEIMDLNFVGTLDLYIDGADEVDNNLVMVKGGGAALTREKIVAAASHKFVCMVDGSKTVETLGRSYPVPIEVLPQARSYVARQLVEMGAEPVYRAGVVTDYGNVILDTYDLNITDALDMEQKINNIVGVVCNGVFAANKADVLLKATAQGVETITK